MTHPPAPAFAAPLRALRGGPRSPQSGILLTLLDGLVLVQFFQPHDHHTVPMRSMVVTLCRHGSVRRAGCGVGACGPERRGKSQKSPSKRQRHGSQHGVRHLPQPVTWLEAGGKERTGRVMPKQCCALVGRLLYLPSQAYAPC